MRSKRFCAEDQGFFSEAVFQKHASLAVVLGTYTCRHDYWHCVITPGLQVSWHEFVCMARSVLVSTVRRLVRRCWRLLCSRFLFLVGFRIGPTFVVMLLLFAAVCSVSLVLAQFGRTHVWTGQGHIFETLQYKRRAPSWIKLKPEDLKKQIGKLAEKYDALVVDVTLRDGFSVPQVKLVTDIKFLHILKKKGLAPSILEDLYSLVKKAKSMRKHLDKYRKDRDSKFRLILVESRIHRLARYYRRVKFLPANWKYVSATASTGTCDAPFNDERINFFGRSRQRMRSKRFCAEDRGFLSEGGGAVPFRESLDYGIRSF